MDVERARELTETILSAWNSQDVERVVSCYTEDCLYSDPNTKGPLVGRKTFRRYLGRLFRQWEMQWSLKELFMFSDGTGVAFLWRARLRPSASPNAVEIDGMDLAVIREGKLCRNEVYFDRRPLLELGKRHEPS